MKDEKFLYLRDLRDKKSTANSARHRRTHCGKGGGVRFPSDKLSKKEREKMNGKLEVYRLNSPMKYSEFKAMPEEHQKSYIKLLRQKYDVPDSRIAAMMGVSQCNFSKHIIKSGLGTGHRPGVKKWDVDGWNAWAYGSSIEEQAEQPAFSATYPDDSFELVVDDDNGIETEKAQTEDVLSEEVEFICKQAEVFPPAEERVEEQESFCVKEKICSVPETGSLTFTGDAESIVNTLTALLGNTKVLLTVKWDVVD